MLTTHDGKKAYVLYLELMPGGFVGFEGNQKRKFIGSGTIGNGYSASITNVLLVDGLMHNLMSISQLSENSYGIIFNQKSCKAISQKDSFTLFNGKRKNKIYKTILFDFKDQNVKCLMPVNEDNGSGIYDWAMLA